MAELHRAVASLRIAGDDLIPDWVTARLGCSPTLSYARGATIASNHGPTRVARFGLWTLAADETSPADLDAQVASLLGRLSGDIDVWSALRAEFDINLFCGWFMRRWNEGATMDAETLAELGARGIRLDVDLYGPDQEDPREA